MATTGTLRNLRVKLNAAPDNGGGTQSYAFTVMINGVATAVTCTISELATTCNDLVNTTAVVAGNTMSLRSAPTASQPQATIAAWTIVIQ